jgi:hypothetical protein
MWRSGLTAFALVPIGETLWGHPYSSTRWGQFTGSIVYGVVTFGAAAPISAYAGCYEVVGCTDADYFRE